MNARCIYPIDGNWMTTVIAANRHVEKLNNVRNLRTHVAKMRNAFSISTSAGIPVDEFRRVELLRDSIIGHHQMVKTLMDYDHDFPELQSHTFARMAERLLGIAPTQCGIAR